MPKPDYDQFPQEKTPVLQDHARQLEEDLRRLTVHYQLLKSDKASLEQDFARYKRATRKMLYGVRGIKENKKWADMAGVTQKYLKECGFKPSDFD